MLGLIFLIKQDAPTGPVNGKSSEDKRSEKGTDGHGNEEGSDNGESNKNETKGDSQAQNNESTADTTQSKDRFDALVRDRDSLRAEVTDMRKSLEEIQSKHQTEMEALQQKVDDAENRKDEAETQFQQLLERVNIIKSQLGERLKEDEVRYNVRAFLFFYISGS